MAMLNALWACSSWRWPSVTPIAHWATSCGRQSNGSISTTRPDPMRAWAIAPPINTPRSKDSKEFLLLPCYSLYDFGYLTQQRHGSHLIVYTRVALERRYMPFFPCEDLTTSGE